MPRQHTRQSARRRLTAGQQLETRHLLAGLPWGATPADTAEYMLGDVWVTVAAMESTGQVDADTERWQPAQLEVVRRAVTDGLRWWEDQLARYTTRHHLKFHVDFTMLDYPVATRYEPISRPSGDVNLWAGDFLNKVGFESSADLSVDIRRFNHSQRVAHAVDWAFTILVVNAERDADGRFDPSGEFASAFAFPGGQFLVLPSHRPASTVAHEVGHIFWAMDEYAGSRPYTDRRGYYNTQNTNAVDANPRPELRELSIMDRAGTAMAAGAISRSARESIGWKDSDGDGLFDVLDVEMSLTAAAKWDASQRELEVSGRAAVRALNNLNPSGQGNDITLNRIGVIEYRVDGGRWKSLGRVDQPETEFHATLGPFWDAGTRQVELRAVEDRWGVYSNVWTTTVTVPPDAAVIALDVNQDGAISPIDALLVINRLNLATTSPPIQRGAAVEWDFDVNRDGKISPSDALRVIQHLNHGGVAPLGSLVVSPVGTPAPIEPQAAEALAEADAPAGLGQDCTGHAESRSELGAALADRAWREWEWEPPRAKSLAARKVGRGAQLF